MVPASEEARKMLTTIKDGADCLGEFKGARSIRQLRLWWALMGLLVENTCFPTKEAASDATKIACGHCDVYYLPDTGEAKMHPRSIAFQSLSQHEFSEIFEAALNVVCARWLDGADKDEVRSRAIEMIDGARYLGLEAR